MSARRPSPLRSPAFDDAAIAAAGRRAKALWTKESEAERDRLLRLPPAPYRLAALDDEQTRQLLTPEHRAEVRDSIDRVLDEKRARADRLAAQAAEAEARRARWQAEREAMERLDRLRPWACWVGVPIAAALPAVAKAAAAGWGFLDVLAAAAEAPGLLSRALAGVAAGALLAAAAAFYARRAPSVRALGWCTAAAAAAGVLVIFAAWHLPISRAAPTVRLADGTSLAGAVVRIERLWPSRPDRLHILRGNAGLGLGRGTILELEGGRPAAYLRGSR